MITFELSCESSHRFEGWFRNREDFEDQLSRGLVVCPLCGSVRIEKRLSPVAVHVARRTGRRPRPADGPEPPAQPAAAGEAGRAAAPTPAAYFQAVAAFLETHFEDVGASFAQEARKIEAGDVDARNIRGTTTPAEEESLREEGIEFLKIALPKYDA